MCKKKRSCVWAECATVRKHELSACVSHLTPSKLSQETSDPTKSPASAVHNKQTFQGQQHTSLNAYHHTSTSTPHSPLLTGSYTRRQVFCIKWTTLTQKGPDGGVRPPTEFVCMCSSESQRDLATGTEARYTVRKNSVQRSQGRLI